MRPVIFLLLCWAASWASAQAAEVQPVFTMDYVVELYRYEFAQIQTRVINFCRDLLFYLASFAFVTTGIKLILLQGEIKLFCYNMVRLMFTVGAVYFLIFNGPAISTDIVNSLISLALDHPIAGSGEKFDGVSQLFVISDFLAQSELLRNLVEPDLGISTASLMALLSFILIHGLVALLTVIFAVTYLNAYFNAVCGVLVVVLGVFGFTRSISLHYLFHTLAYGLKLFTLCLIYTIGTRVLNGIFTDLNAINEANATISLQYLGLLLSVMFLIVGLAVSMPNMVASLVSNTCTTHSTNLYPSLRTFLRA